MEKPLAYFEDGGWKPSSTSHSSWLSKIWLLLIYCPTNPWLEVGINQIIAGEITGGKYYLPMRDNKYVTAGRKPKKSGINLGSLFIKDVSPVWEQDTFTGKIVAALRNEFDGHAVEQKQINTFQFKNKGE